MLFYVKLNEAFIRFTLIFFRKKCTLYFDGLKNFWNFLKGSPKIIFALYNVVKFKFDLRKINFNIIDYSL